MKILLWNIEWATPKSKCGHEIRRIYHDISPDIACITESYLNFWQDEGNIISSTEDYGYKITEGRRKVVLISTSEWEEFDYIGNEDLPIGRYCHGKTHGLNIHGVCIPWKDANVRNGQRNKIPWEDHINYLDTLEPLIKDSHKKTIVLGDYNQRIPRKWSPEDIYSKLLKTFEPNFNIWATGTIKEIDKQAIDHFASTHDISAKNIIIINNRIGSLQLSDHFGFVIEI